MFGGISAAGRKIAKPRGRAGRFSDVHLAQFKKMDSIASHPSALRAKQPGFAQPTTQSLKRSGSKAGLDEVDRPQTAGKGTPGRRPPPFRGHPTSSNPFKSISQPSHIEKTNDAKRARRSEFHDVSTDRSSNQPQIARPQTLPRPVSSSLLSPTKSSLARVATSQIPVTSPSKTPGLARTTSSKSLRPASSVQPPRPSTSHGAGSIPASPDTSAARPSTSHGASNGQTTWSKIPQFRGSPERPLPSLPVQSSSSPSPARDDVRASAPSLPATGSHSSFISRLPKLSGLKSILRSPRKTDAAVIAKVQQATPKRLKASAPASGSTKKVDFTPSVKSRYAVKLAAGSPSPAKLPHELTPGHALGPTITYDPAAYTIDDEDMWEDDDEGAGDVEYPMLPEPSSSPFAPPKIDHTFVNKAKDHNRRESKDFKSIFTTLHHPSRPSAPSNLTSVNTIVNKTDPNVHANKIMRSPNNPNFSNPSPSTIRRVRTSGVTEAVQPFKDINVKTMPHGLPGKKRRRASDDQQSIDTDSGKENRCMSVMPGVPGGWQDSTISDEEEQDEGEKRGGKRLRTGPALEKSPADKQASPVKKPRPSSAREVAKKTAKDRKGGPLLSFSRLQFLSQPKQRD